MLRRPPLPRTLQACLRDARDEKAVVRASAIREVVRYGGEARAAVVGCLEHALRDEAAAVRASAAVGLADLQASESLAALLFAVEDDDSHVRQMALAAIGELGDPRAQERLRRALRDGRPEVRFQAIIAVTRVAPDEALATAVAAVEDEDANVRYVAIRCIEEATLGKRQPLPDAVVAQLIARLADPTPSVRVVCAIVLARAGHREGVPVLLGVVRGQSKTPEPEDEAAAVELAGELGLSEVIPDLTRRAFGLLRLRSDPFAWQAMVALARMGDARAQRKILNDLSARSRDRRTMAVAAAGRARLETARALIEAMQRDPQSADPSAVALTLDQLNGRDPFDTPEAS